VVIRAGADGELCAADLDALHDLREADPTTDERLACERTLRARLARVMWRPDRAPHTLRSEIRAMFERERGAGLPAVAPAGPLGRRDRTFWIGGPTWLAVAAALALLTAVSVVSRWPIAPAPWPGIQTGINAHLASAAHFIVAEHDRCSEFDTYYEHKFTVRDAASAGDAAVALLGTPPAAVRLNDAGYRFAGLGRCAVPGPGVSLHMLYTAIDPGRPTLSLFVQQDTGRDDIEPGVRYRVNHPDGSAVYAWRDGGLVYYLFSPDARAEADATRLLGAPALERSL